jgi:ABC-type multidrug transport system ATPase subunit
LRLPDGYATRIGGSVLLSGGQVQRVGLARALCGKPRLVVLDEPNSNLDAAGEECLTRAIAQLREAGSVVVVMTHRPNVLLATNKVLVLEAGRMIEFGEREALMVRPAEAALTDARPFTAAFPPPKPRVVSGYVDPALRNRAEESASGRPEIAAEGQGRQRAPGTSPDFQRRMRGFASEATPSALQQRGKP